MMTTKTEQKAEAKEHVEHMMEAFPSLSGMPSQWHEHDIAAAKIKIMAQAKKDEMAKEKAAKVIVKFEEDVEKAQHIMEKFPSLKIEPKDWHCNTCEDDEVSKQ
ncbi:MAG: hypothetical protein HN736_10020 [Anaerolineae bacterium]|jgi:hypothetical protein|nr:hypothetical protein [Anaerolineae bacterium]MBT3714363.1 hypothetical protein [Anaerolineae bacterium]MBT4312394.1 hypothetical protein [Anaerolineae bacterium]MBT4459352.1 hypothetical protein [Anaerolineae bacterium]MBT6062276.1 hypothetical protein [Anaerolineae bacterium]